MSYQEEFGSSCLASEGGATAQVDAEYFHAYSDLSVHRVMLDDHPRMAFYQSLMSDASVVGNRVVVDVGAGTGLLGLWAIARGGAAHVISIEASGLARTLEATYAANQLSARGHVVNERVEDLIAAGVPAFLKRFPWIVPLGGVDIVVSEWMGFYLLHECMLPSVLAARDFFHAVNAEISFANTLRLTENTSGLADAGRPQTPKPLRLIPSEATLFVAPVSTGPWVKAKSDYWTASVNRDWNSAAPHCSATLTGCDTAALQRPLNLELLGVVEAETLLSAAPNPLVDVMPAAGVLRPAQVVAALDLESCSSLQAVELDGVRVVFPPTSKDPPACRSASEVPQNVEVTTAMTVHGFCFWFDVRFGDLVLSTAPSAPPTHWKQTVVLLPEEVGWRGNAMELEPDDDLVLLVSFLCSDVSLRQYRIEVEIGE